MIFLKLTFKTRMGPPPLNVKLWLSEHFDFVRVRTISFWAEYMPCLFFVIMHQSCIYMIPTFMFLFLLLFLSFLL